MTLKKIYFFIFTLALVASCNNDNIENKNETIKQDPTDTSVKNDTIKQNPVNTDPVTVSCPKNIFIEVNYSTTDTIVNYDLPTTKTINSTITLTSGLASGSSFPIGTTTINYEITTPDNQKDNCSFNITVTQKDKPIVISSDIPFILDNSIATVGKKWIKDTQQSDEFDDNNINFTKWRLTSSGNWIGRSPGLFLKENVSESDGNLRIKATKLANNRTINGSLFTHGGGYVEGLHPMNVGLYLECKMKANKTFLSSTFWLNNKRGEGNGCDIRVTELDIQECVGTLTGTSSLALRGWDKIMHSNTHSRTTSCDETPIGSSPKWSSLGENAAENYHVYGAWWKSPREIICYLDGKKIHTLTPKADFNLNSYLRLVVETYDWNPTPADGGIDAFTELERTTLYDWVRVWKLENE